MPNALPRSLLLVFSLCIQKRIVSSALHTVKLLITLPKKAEVELGAMIDALQVFDMLADHNKSDNGINRRADAVPRHQLIDHREDHRCGDRHNTDVIDDQYQNDLCHEHQEKDQRIEGKNDATKTRKPLSAAKPQEKWENMTQDAACSRKCRIDHRAGKKRLGYLDREIRLDDIKERRQKADLFSHCDHGIGCSRIA